MVEEIEKRENIEKKIVGPQTLTDSEVSELRADIKKQKIKKVIAINIPQVSSEKSILLWGYQFPEIKKTFMVDPQLHGEDFKTKTLREEKYYVLDHSEADAEKIKEKIKEFFIKDELDNLVEKKIRINGTGKGREVIKEIRDFLEEHKEIDASVSDCKFQLEENFKSNNFVDDQSKQYFRLKNLLKEGMIKIPDDIPIESQIDAVEWDVDNQKDKAELPEENQEHIKSLLLFCWGGGFPFAFMKP